MNYELINRFPLPRVLFLLVDKLEVFLSENEAVTEVFLPYNLILGKLFRRTTEQYAALEQQICTVGDAQGLLHVVVGYKDADVAVFKLPHNVLNVLNGNRVYAGKGLVEHDKLRIDGQTARNLSTAALTSRKLVTLVLAHLVQAELAYEALQLSSRSARFSPVISSTAMMLSSTLSLRNTLASCGR